VLHLVSVPCAASSRWHDERPGKPLSYHPWYPGHSVHHVRFFVENSMATLPSVSLCTYLHTPALYLISFLEGTRPLRDFSCRLLKGNRPLRDFSYCSCFTLFIPLTRVRRDLELSSTRIQGSSALGHCTRVSSPQQRLVASSSLAFRLGSTLSVNKKYCIG